MCFLYYCPFYSPPWLVIVYTPLIEIYNPRYVLYKPDILLLLLNQCDAEEFPNHRPSNNYRGIIYPQQSGLCTLSGHQSIAPYGDHRYSSVHYSLTHNRFLKMLCLYCVPPMPPIYTSRWHWYHPPCDTKLSGTNVLCKYRRYCWYRDCVIQRH